MRLTTMVGARKRKKTDESWKRQRGGRHQREAELWTCCGGGTKPF